MVQKQTVNVSLPEVIEENVIYILITKFNDKNTNSWKRSLHFGSAFVR